MRLLTRSDFDGLVCATILKGLGVVSNIRFVHPKDIQDNKIRAGKNDVIANLPYAEGCGLWFDHHFSEITRLSSKVRFEGAYDLQPSAARVIYNYYRMKQKYSQKIIQFKKLVKVADTVDSASFSVNDILDPQEWIMLAFITDPRSNFGKNRLFKISNLSLLKGLPDLLSHKSVDKILAMPDFAERVKAYHENLTNFKRFLTIHSYVQGKAIITDIRGKGDIPIGNRFLEYVLYPQQNISIRIIDGKNREFVMISVGHSIINRSSDVNVGNLMLRYAGGGHQRAGTCQVSYADADGIIREILAIINKEHLIVANLAEPKDHRNETANVCRTP